MIESAKSAVVVEDGGGIVVDAVRYQNNTSNSEVQWILRQIEHIEHENHEEIME